MILAPKFWPKILTKERRGITRKEHKRIIKSEKNEERRLYYQLLWETGGSQTDIVKLKAKNILWDQGIICYQRRKLKPDAPPAQMVIGPGVAELLRKLPKTGPLFPHWSTVSEGARASEFGRRCRVAKVYGVSLHCYRYSWAERGLEAGYPERFAQAALGHSSKAVHRSYAKLARVVCPSLEEYEKPKLTILPKSRSRKRKAA
jgi:integrase